MNNKIIPLSLFSLLFISSTAFAHDAKFHKGPKIEGKLMSIQSEHAEVQTDKGKVLVTLLADTKFEIGMDGKAGSQSDLKQGQHIIVSGHKLESGEFAATEVMIHSDSASGKNEPTSPEEHHDMHSMH